MPPSTTDYCADLVRRYDRERYITALFAPAAVRPHLLALYAFNLEVARTREAVSEPMLGEIRLQWWREAVDEIQNGRPRRHEVVESLAAAIGDRADLRVNLDAIIDARAADLYDQRHADMAELEAYAEATSANVIHAALALLGPAPDLGETARHAGIAVALSGLIEAVPFHARQNRMLLPLDLLERHGLTSRDVLGGRQTERLRPVLAEVATAAETHLAAARQGAGRLPAHILPALLPASLAAARLSRLRRRHYDLAALPARGPGAGAIAGLTLRAWRRRF